MEKIENKKELLYKPNQTIMITSEEITVTQRKAYNVILHKVWNELKINPNKILFNLSISEIKNKSGIKATNNVELKTNLIKLKRIEVDTIKDNGDWLNFNLLAQVKKVDDELEIQLPEAIRQALINNTFYTTLDLLTIKSLQSKYAIILYEIAIRYQKKQIPELTIEEIKALTGTGKIKSYNNFKHFNVNVLTPAIEEINEKTDITLSFKEIKGAKNKVVAIKFTIHSNLSEIEQTDNTVITINKEILKISPEEQKNIDLMGQTKEILEIFKNKYNEELEYLYVNRMIRGKGIETIKKYLDEFPIFVNEVRKRDKEIDSLPRLFTYFANKIKAKNKAKTNSPNIPQLTNFEQRTYTEADFDNFFNKTGE